MNRFASAAAAILLVSTAANAQQIVEANQGRPGNKGCWPVCLSGPIVVSFGDGGVKFVATNPDGGTPLDVNVAGWFGSTAPTVGQKPSASSIPVVLPSDQTLGVNILDAGVLNANVNVTNTVSVNVLDAGVLNANANITNTVNVNIIDAGSIYVLQGDPPWIVEGNKTNNDAAPGSNNLGVLPALATAAPPAYTEGNQVLLSTDLGAKLRVIGFAPDGGALNDVTVTNTVNVNIVDGGTINVSSSTGFATTRTYGCGTSRTNLQTFGVGVAGTRTSQLTIFNPAGSGVTAKLTKVIVSFSGGNAGRFVILGTRTTTDVGAGSTSETVQGHDSVDSATALSCKVGGAAPTRTAGQQISEVVGGSSEDRVVYDESLGVKPITLNSDQGFELSTEVQTAVGIGTASVIAVQMEWTEQ